jgi:hypothetical protein
LNASHITTSCLDPLRTAGAGEHEIKYALAPSIVSIVEGWLQRRCRPDPSFPEGMVSSIYFDTRRREFLQQKLNSDFLKSKVRIRWYGDLDSGKPDPAAFIEAKLKTGGRRAKVRIKSAISGEHLAQLPLSDPRLSRIPHELHRHGVTFVEPLFPVFQLNYRRRRFVEPTTGSRVSLDYHIHVSRTNPQLVPHIGPVRLNRAVLELKGLLHELPNFLHQLTALGCRKEAFSKYGLCFVKLLKDTV